MDMFNPEQKQEYIDYEKTNQQSLTNYFKRVSDKEREYDKDIADMDIDELKSTFISLNIRSEAARSHFISLIRGYINWAILNNKTENNSPINEITAKSIGTKYAVTSQMLKNPRQVIDILGIAMPSDKYQSLPNRYDRDKLVFWLLYSGLELEEIQQLKKDEIDKENKTIIHAGRKYGTYDLVISLWTKVSEMTYIEKTGTKSNSGIINYDLVDSDYLFRPIAGRDIYREPFFKIGVFMAIIQKIFKAYLEEVEGGVKSSPSNIRISGIFYKLYLLESEGTEIASDLLVDYLNIEYQNDYDLYSKTRKWRMDYEDWKIAFDYYV